MNINDLYNIVIWIDGIIFYLILCAVCYIFIFAVFSFKKQKINFKKTKKQYNFLILITTREIDDSIYKSLHSLYDQDFPDNNYDIAIISKHISEKAERDFYDSPVTLIKRPKEEHYRSRILDYALKQIDKDYDIIVIMKAGNTTDSNFLNEINKAYHSGGMAIQTHCVRKNIKSNTAILNALSEEINNSIFRRGHVNLGFSSGLIGSGMAFNYRWFKKNIGKVKKNGLTKQLEILLLKQGIFIEYLENLYTYDERDLSRSDNNSQRQHWYSAKFSSLIKVIGDLPKSFIVGNFDYCDKIIQWIIPSKFFLLFVIILFAFGLLFLDWILAIKWFGLLFFIMLVIDLTIPQKFQNWRTFFALFSLPTLTILNFFYIFRKDRK